MDVDTIQYIQSVFKQADTDGGGDLDENEFVTAFAGKLHSNEGSDEARIQSCGAQHSHREVLHHCNAQSAHTGLQALCVAPFVTHTGFKLTHDAR